MSVYVKGCQTFAHAAMVRQVITELDPISRTVNSQSSATPGYWQSPLVGNILLPWVDFNRRSDNPYQGELSA